MPFYGAGGYSQAMNDIVNQRAIEAQIAESQSRLPITRLQEEFARNMLEGYASGGRALNYAVPELPPLPGVQRGPIPPGVGQASAPAATFAAPAPAGQIPPYQALPAPSPAGPLGEEGREGEIPAQPAMSVEQAARAQAETKSLDQMVQAMRAMGVQPEKMIYALEAVESTLSNETKRELQVFKTHTAALTAATKTYSDIIRAQAAQSRAATGERRAETYARDVESRVSDRDERNRIARERLAQMVGGGQNIVKWEYDKNDPTLVIGGWTRSGRRVLLDQPGRGTSRQDRPEEIDINRKVNRLRGELSTLIRLQESSARPDPQRKARMNAIEAELRELGAKPSAKPKAKSSGRGAPAVGAVQGGYRFKGGDPSKRENWEKI